MIRIFAAALAFMTLVAADLPPEKAAAIFGAREGVSDLSLSPAGDQVAFVGASNGRGATLFTMALGDGAKAQRVLEANGNPERIAWCRWVSNKRLACMIYGVVKSMLGGGLNSLPFTRMIAVDADGGNPKMLSVRETQYMRDIMLGGGEIIDWLPDDKGAAVLMARTHVPDDHLGTRLGSTAEGFGVDRIDTRTLSATVVEKPVRNANTFISDGRGVVRVMGIADIAGATGQFSGIERYRYRKQGSRDWQPLSTRSEATREGFLPVAVDSALDVAFGFDQKDGRRALYKVALDGSGKTELLFARPDVDVDDLIRVGRQNRVVGVSYVDERREAVYFDPEIARLVAGLSKALPKTPMVSVVDASADESKLLVHAGSDDDPGVYYIFDRTTKTVHTFLVNRPQLEGIVLAKQKSILYRAADGTMIPAYLTLPAGKEQAKGLPGVVLPHGGPQSRDEWGFDWLPQYYAARGYAVIQPQFRGSAGYGEAWFQKNGFQSWRIAVGDVVDAGRWLIGQGVADPNQLAVVGWSYGGYAALQSAVLAPGLFKAVVAIAPVTDLGLLKQESVGWRNHQLAADFIGSGAHIREGSPAQNAAAIKVPVLLAHGTIDRNVGYGESTLMAARLRASGGKVELLTFDGLDHQLDDSDARAKLLSQSDIFLRTAFGN